MVSFVGSSGTIDFTLGAFQVVELPVATLSIKTSLPTGLPLGLIVMDYPLTMFVDGAFGQTTNQLVMGIDNSNDSATLLGGIGTTTFNLSNGMTIRFQMFTASTGAANDGVTLSTPVTGQFNSFVTPIPEPSTIILFGLGMAAILLFSTRRPNCQK